MANDELETIRRYVAEHPEQSILDSLLQNIDATRSGTLIDTGRLNDAIAVRLTADQVDALTLDALADGCTLEEFAVRLIEARELASEGVPLDSRGRLVWAI